MKTITTFAALFFLSAFALLGQDANAILGTWLVEDKDAQVEIYSCGDKFCGKIVWLEAPNDEAGNPRKDKLNADKSLRDRPIMGVNLMQDFVFDGTTWSDGTIYNSRDGKTYAGYLKLNEDGSLFMKGGYKIMGMMIGKSNTWTRVN